MKTKAQKEVQTTGLTFSNNGQRREEKMSNLKATKYQNLTKHSIILPFICDKQVVASAFRQLRINFSSIFKVFQITLVTSRLGQFCEDFENAREINP